MSIVTLAKRIVEQGPQAYPSISKAMLYSEIAKRADATRRAGETDESAFTRVATTDADGRALFAAYKVAGGEDYRPAAVVAAAEPVVTSAAYETLAKKAEELRQLHPELSEAQAFTKIYEDPKNRELVAADRAAHYERVGKAFGVRAPGFQKLGSVA